MDNKSNYKLIYDLFDYIIIFDKNDNVVFEGAELKNLLDSTHGQTSWRTSPTDRSKSFNEIIQDAKAKRELSTFKFTGIKDEFILFPIYFDNSFHLILTQKLKIDQITNIEHDLNERVKELRCLYNVSKELEVARPLDESIQKCLNHVQTAFQFPEEIVVIFEIGKKSFGKIDITQNPDSTFLTSDINVNDKKFGQIKVLFKNKKGVLEEERKMIDEIARKLARAIEESEKTINLEKQQKILLAKNEALLKLTDECNNRRAKLRTFFSAITDKIVVIDKEFNITMSNKDGIGDTGKCYKKLFNLDQRCEKCPAEKTFETAEHIAYEREVDDKYFMLRSYPILDQSEHVEGVLEVCHDVTVQKKMEAQLLQSYKLASLGKLVAGVAHEINNPNTFILGNLKIIQEAFHDIFPILEENYARNKELKIARLNYGLFKENISTLVDDMINGANRTKKIVGDLRNFAKKDDGSLTDQVDLNYIIKNNLTLTSKHVKKFADLEIDLDENLPTFEGNSNKLEQVILNLVMNASEAIESENGLIKIKTGYDGKKNEVLLIVEDTGCGMDENTIKNIFDPFFTTKRNCGGTGLGLSITYGIIKDHHGKIEVDSKIGTGTKFTIRFPVNQNV
ncbi:MAG: ATP-binding protein [Ignavibacteriales bacterium]|nr:ATP-binding protein [Ignavibacteriales bacterium]